MNEVRTCPPEPAKPVRRRIPKGTIAYPHTQHSQERAARRTGYISARQQKRNRQLLRAIRRGQPSYAGQTISIDLREVTGLETSIAAFRMPDRSVRVVYAGQQP